MKPSLNSYRLDCHSLHPLESISQKQTKKKPEHAFTQPKNSAGSLLSSEQSPNSWAWWYYMDSQSTSRAPLLPQRPCVQTTNFTSSFKAAVTCWSDCLPPFPPGKLIFTLHDPAQISSPVQYQAFTFHSHLHLLRCLFSQYRNLGVSLDFFHIHSTTKS